jgi:hypothetical protein
MGSLGPGSKIYQPFSGVGALCGFSTYYNGTEEVNVDFDYRASLYLDGDSVQTNLSSTCDLVAGETFKVKVYVASGDLDTFDVPFFVDSDTTSSSVDIQYISGSQSLRFTWDDDTGTQKSQIFDKPMVFDKWIEITVTTGATFECTIDGTPYTGSAVVGGTSVINRITVGARNTTPTNPVTALFESFESVCAGVVSFISNQDDGDYFITDIGEVWTLTEDVAGSSQIKADGTSSTAYVWPDAAKLYLPAVGYSQFDLTNVLSQSIATKVNIDFSAEWVLVIENIFVASDAVDDCQIVQWNDVLGRTLTFVYDQTNRRFRCTVFDGTSNKTVNVGSLVTPVEYDTRHHVIIRSVGGTTAARPYEMEVVGYTGTNIDTDTLDFTPYTVQNTSFFNVGGVGKKFSGKIGNIYWVTPTGATYFDTFPLETRVPANTDPNVDDIVGLDNSSILEASVDRSYKFPYYSATQYLVEQALQAVMM